MASAQAVGQKTAMASAQAIGQKTQVTATVGNPKKPQAPPPTLSGFASMEPSAHPWGVQPIAQPAMMGQPVMMGMPSMEYAYGQVPFYGKNFKAGKPMNPEKDPRFGKVDKKGFQIDQKQLKMALAQPTYFSANNTIPSMNLSHKKVPKVTEGGEPLRPLHQTATLDWDFDGHSKLESKLDKQIEKKIQKEGYASFTNLDAVMLDEHPADQSVFIDPRELTF